MTPDDINLMRADMAKGTPGPWARQTKPDWWITTPTGNRVARIMAWRDRMPEAGANARRIARVPTLEAEVLRLTEERAALAEELTRVRDVLTEIASHCNNIEMSLAQRLAHMARAALSHTGMTGATK